MRLDEYQQRNRLVLGALESAQQRCGVHTLDPLTYLCKAGTCRGAIDNRPLYADRHYLSELGNRLLIPLFRQVFAQGEARE